ncbi:MAG TPA: uracil-DNA glycosylase family protein, partial [Gammaproteobacteria bacterium]
MTVNPTLPAGVFNIDCRDCPRLASFLDSVKKKHPDYHCRPVAPFGDARARLLIVGLAPGLHGANRTGRPFTGDFAGILLYETLHRHGLGSKPESVSADDG